MFKLQVQDDDNDARVWHDVKGADGAVLTFEKEDQARVVDYAHSIATVRES